jgi:hypothetical protein
LISPRKASISASVETLAARRWRPKYARIARPPRAGFDASPAKKEDPRDFVDWNRERAGVQKGARSLLGEIVAVNLLDCIDRSLSPRRYSERDFPEITTPRLLIGLHLPGAFANSIALSRDEGGGDR